jgi:hypothetical protein
MSTADHAPPTFQFPPPPLAAVSTQKCNHTSKVKHVQIHCVYTIKPRPGSPSRWACNCIQAQRWIPDQNVADWNVTTNRSVTMKQCQLAARQNNTRLTLPSLSTAPVQQSAIYPKWGISGLKSRQALLQSPIVFILDQSQKGDGREACSTPLRSHWEEQSRGTPRRNRGRRPGIDSDLPHWHSRSSSDLDIREIGQKCFGRKDKLRGRYRRGSWKQT